MLTLVSCEYAGNDIVDIKAREENVHYHARYNPAQSSSSKILTNEDNECPTKGQRWRDCKNAAIHNNQTLLCDRTCIFEIHFIEDSGVRGLYVNDVFHIGDLAGNASFGCATWESGPIKSQRADGVLGLARGSSSIVKQMQNNEVIDDDIFSLCLSRVQAGIDGVDDEQGESGVFILGSETPDTLSGKFVFTPIVDSRKGNNRFYYLRLNAIRFAFDGHNHYQRIAISETMETNSTQIPASIIDTGTTFSYFPMHVFREIIDEIINVHCLMNGGKQRTEDVVCRQVESPFPELYDDNCFVLEDAQQNPWIGDINVVFPQLILHFGGDESSEEIVKTLPENYLFRHVNYSHGNGWCVGIFGKESNEENGGALIGALMMRNFFVQYDRKRMQIGFVKAQCSDFARPQTSILVDGSTEVGNYIDQRQLVESSNVDFLTVIHVIAIILFLIFPLRHFYSLMQAKQRHAQT